MSKEAAGKKSEADIFLHVQTKRAGKIKGESRTESHIDDIEVRAWTWGVMASTAIGSGQATGRRQYRNLVVQKGIDAASTALMSVLATNDEVKEAVLTMRKGGGDVLDYFKMTLNGARVVDVSLVIDGAGSAVESVSIAFTKIDIQYINQSAGGGGKATTTFNDDWGIGV